MDWIEDESQVVADKYSYNDPNEKIKKQAETKG